MIGDAGRQYKAKTKTKTKGGVASPTCINRLQSPRTMETINVSKGRGLTCNRCDLDATRSDSQVLPII